MITCPLPGEGGEPAHVVEARRVIRDWELRNGHATYVECLDGGHRGYRAACSDCEWRGHEHLRGDELMGTEASRAHKIHAKEEAWAHTCSTRPVPQSRTHPEGGAR